MKKRYIAALLLLIGGFVYFYTNPLTSEKEIKEFTAFFDVEKSELNEQNEVKELIAEITGARCTETWLVGQSREVAIHTFIASGQYPDFISGDYELYEADALIAIDEYWDDYPYLKSYMEEYEWDRLRLNDGHIYWIPQFGVSDGKLEESIHEGEAFWIQTRVLKWAGYPDIRTVEEYFDLIEEYMEANPVMENGTPNIPYTILCDDWRYFCLENPPQFLDGYPNDGCCIVDPVTLQVMDYNVTPTAKEYFRILNEEYQRGYIDPESFTQTYEEYIAKLSTGAVLGMVDQWWQFYYAIDPILYSQGLKELGCDYAPLPITIDRSIKNQWHVRRDNEYDFGSGLAITKSCKDVEGALQFINDLLSPEVMKLRFWGVEGTDYEVDENGIFYRTPEQRVRGTDQELAASHFCVYPYFPRVEGLSADGKNAFSPEYQPGETYIALSQNVKDCLEAYGCKSYVDMLGSNEAPGVWYPMYSYTDMLTESSEAGRVYGEIEELKHTWLPRVVMSEDFETTWAQYMEAYQSCCPEILYEDMQRELERRIKIASNRGEGI